MLNSLLMYHWSTLMGFFLGLCGWFLRFYWGGTAACSVMPLCTPFLGKVQDCSLGSFMQCLKIECKASNINYILIWIYPLRFNSSFGRRTPNMENKVKKKTIKNMNKISLALSIFSLTILFFCINTVKLGLERWFSSLRAVGSSWGGPGFNSGFYMVTHNSL